MTLDDSSQWNDEARIACRFTFKCPKLWHLLKPTAVDGVRHCPECDRDVHLALTEDEFRRHSEQGLCIAVPLATDDPQALEENIPYTIGELVAPYDGERMPEPPDEAEMSEHE